MNGYKAFYNGKEIDVYALTSYAAQCLAVEKFKAPKSKAHMVSVMLCEKDGEQVTHSTASIG
jgi:hypothetical protein